jgi:hypothetical protein
MCYMMVMSSTNMDPYWDSSVTRDYLMRLSEDGPICGPKHVATNSVAWVRKRTIPKLVLTLPTSGGRSVGNM